MPERVRCCLKSLTDLGEFSRRNVDPLLLGLRLFLLAVSTIAKRLELVRHPLDGPGEVGQLARDEFCVVQLMSRDDGFYASDAAIAKRRRLAP